MLVFYLYFISNQSYTMRINHYIVWLCQGDEPRPTLPAFNSSIEHRGAESKGIGAQPQIKQGCHYHEYPKSLCVDHTRILLEEDNGVLHRRDWYCYNGIIRVKSYPHHDNWGQDFQLHYHISWWSSKFHLWPTTARSSLPWRPNTALHVSSTPSSPCELSLHLQIKTPSLPELLPAFLQSSTVLQDMVWNVNLWRPTDYYQDWFFIVQLITFLCICYSMCLPSLFYENYPCILNFKLSSGQSYNKFYFTLNENLRFLFVNWLQIEFLNTYKNPLFWEIRIKFNDS